MDADTIPKRRASTKRTSSRQPGTVRIKPKPHDPAAATAAAAAAAAAKPTTPSFSDDQSLTSFPSLSPSLENSPSSPARAFGPSPSGSHQLQSKSRRVPSVLDGLFEPADPLGTRAALFEDAPAHNRDIPGTLHHQPEKHIEHLISRVGAVQLVKQLSEDLAHRDVQITHVQRRAEERELLLRKMLRDCEVSNMDIEARLRDLELSRPAAKRSLLAPARSRHVSNSSGHINDQMSEALSELIGSDGDSLGGFDSRAGLDEAVVMSPRKGSEISQSDSSRKGSEDSKSTTSARTWKDYFRYGGGSTVTQAVASSRNPPAAAESRDPQTATRNGRLLPHRQGLAADTFSAPPLERSPSATASLQEHLLQASNRSRDHSPSAHSVQSSASVSSWAAKLLGTGKAKQPSDQQQQSNHRAKAASVSGDVKITTESMRKQALLAQSQGFPASSIGGANRHNRAGSLTSIGPNGTIKLINPSDASKSAASSFMPGSPHSIESGPSNAANLGPVEMDAILPDDARPPTLSFNQSLQTPSGQLVDRFGFIYDNRRRHRQDVAAEAFQSKSLLTQETLDSTSKAISAALDIDEDKHDDGSSPSRPESLTEGQQGWSDHLQATNIGVELLSHTPAAAPLTSITTGEGDLEHTRPSGGIVMSKRGSEPAAGLATAPSASRVVSDHAEIATPSVRSGITTPDEPTSPPADPVKTLLEQLTDVHDRLQRDRETRWNEFLRKVRAERSRNEDPSLKDRRNLAFNMPETKLADGELIGVSGLGNKGKLGRAKWAEFRNLVLSGIPTSLRPKIWAECSGAAALRIPGYYEELVHATDHDESVVQQIQMDITRTLTDNIYFRHGHGVQRLKEVLLAYSKRNPDIGYCQGMNLIAGNLLLIMPTAEDAFWVLVALIESILPDRYYDHSLLTSRADQSVLRIYVRELLPALSKQLESLNIDLEAFTFQWFLSVFTDCLSAEALFRVWDIVLCINDGATFMFQVSLTLLKLNEKQLLSMSTAAEVYAYLSQHMTDHAISIDGLIRAAESLRRYVKRDDTIKRRSEAVEVEVEQRKLREDARRGRIEAAKAKQQAVVDEAGQEASQESSSEPPPYEAVARRPSQQELSVAEEGTGPLEVRTPMPIDEELHWRA